MKLLDLFSGIGGFSLGLERAGFRTVAFCEISPKCRHLLATHWPAVPCFDDVTTLTAEQVGPVDAICGGFPCQDISFAGKGAGLAGERSGLWREYARLVRELRPRYVIVENVAALLGRGLGDVLGDLAALGYDAWWDCIPASAVGAPHRRDRLWLVAYPGGVEHEGYGDALRREIAAGLSRAALGDDTDCQQQGAVAELCGGADAQPGRDGDVADSARLQRRRPKQRAKRERVGSRSQSIALGDATLCGRDAPSDTRPGRNQGRGRAVSAGGSGIARGRTWGWQSEPDVGRVAHGVPARVDRLHGLGNAVVPQIPEIIGRAILTAQAECERRAAA